MVGRQRQVRTLMLLIEFGYRTAEAGKSAELQPQKLKWKPIRIVLEEKLST
jgi:hypothetical protein